MPIDEVAYRLTWEVDHFEKYDLDWTMDIEIVEYSGYDSSSIWNAKPFEHPNPILFQGYPPIVKHVDYPYNGIGWPVMSRRMYETLIGVGPFAHRVIPVAVVDSRVSSETWRDADGAIKRSMLAGDYVAVHLTEPKGFFDRDKSKFEVNPSYPDWLGSVDEYVFKVPPEGLPPIFNLKGEFTRYFVSRDARLALRDGRIMGPAYISLQGYAKSGNDEVDVPVVIPPEDLL